MLCLSMRIARRLQTIVGIGLLVCVSWPAPVAARDVTVGVFGLFRPERIDITTPRDAIVVLQKGSVEVQRVLGSGQRLRVESRRERLEINFFNHDGQLALAHGADAVRAEATMCTLGVPGRIQREFAGRVEVTVRQGLLLTRITVQEDAAVQQILRSEMAEGQESEALKAQAILVRTYLRSSTGRHRKDGFDFCDTTHCQFFTDSRKTDDQFSHAAAATRGLVLTFLGRLFQPLYTAACGGRTLAEFVDNSRKQGPDYPYRSVSCSFCAGHPLFKWETTVEKEELLRALKEGLSKAPDELLTSLTEPGEAGELGAWKQAARVRVGRVLGWNIIRSNRYTIEVHSNLVKIKGHGSGHNFGLCQAGALQMSRRGSNMKEILDFYFPGSRIEP